MFPSVRGMGAGRRMGAAFLCVCPVYNHSGKKKKWHANVTDIPIIRKMQPNQCRTMPVLIYKPNRVAQGARSKEKMEPGSSGVRHDFCSHRIFPALGP